MGCSANTGKSSPKNGGGKPASISETNNLQQLHDFMYHKYGVEVDTESFTGADFQAVKQAAQGMASVIDDFPQAVNYFHELKGAVLEIDDFAKANYYGLITVNSELYKSNSELEKAYHASVESGFHPKGTKAVHITSHEAGHILEKALIDKYVSDPRGGIYDRAKKADAWNKSTYTKKVISEACKAVKNTSEGKDKKNIDLIAGVSKYAKINRSETLAECVADYTANREKASLLSIQVWKILKKEFG